MGRGFRAVRLAAVIATLGSVSLWLLTDRHSYTKFESVEQIMRPLDHNDPLVAAGFYDATTNMETVVREAFHFGLLPVPRGLLDRHLLSVVTVSAPLWCVLFLLVAVSRWSGDRGRNASSGPS